MRRLPTSLTDMPRMRQRAMDRTTDRARQRTPAQLYAAYAGAYLALTVLAGLWLRAATLAPALLGGVPFRHAVHAHSHVALFGWTTMALFAVLTEAAGADAACRWRRRHAHAVGAASGAAFVGFLVGGYNPLTIGIATLHVALWVAFARPTWRALAGAPAPARRWYRGALAFLLVAGAGALVPAVLRVRGVDDPWLTRAAVELFLTPFTGGWLLLGALGAAYAHLERPRAHRAAFALLVASTVPSLLLHVPGTPPAAWMPAVGRAGMAGVGAGTLLVAYELLRARVAPHANVPLLRLAGWSALAAGGAELTAASGVAPQLLASRQLVVAYLHVLLLGVVTPALLATAVSARRSARLAVLHGAGLAVTAASLAALGIPEVAARASTAGIAVHALLAAALAGGAASAAAVLALLAPAPRRTPRHAPPSATPARARAAGPRQLILDLS